VKEVKQELKKGEARINRGIKAGEERMGRKKKVIAI
jgi:hypothetical protein